MSKFKKKPVIIEAIQVTHGMMRNFGPFPEWALPHLEGSRTEKLVGSEQIFVNTLEGKIEVRCNDFLIQGVKGEVYPCREDIFKMTYELASPEEVDAFTPRPS